MVSIDVSSETRVGSERLEELYRSHVPGAVRLAYLLTGDADIAQDIAHDAFVRTTGRLRHLRHPDAFAAYLRRAVVNASTSHHRKRSVERSFVRREAGRREIESESLPDVGVRDELRRALGALPARQRTALVLRYYEDLSERQLADAMRCSVPAARSLLSRGLSTLRTTLEEANDDRSGG